MFSRLGILARITLLLVVVNFTLGDNSDFEQLTFCDEAKINKVQNSLVYVSTLDGKISALDLTENGKKLWTLGLDSKPLLSSNIHHADLTDDGSWAKLIPSLKGTLYKFDGNHVESTRVTTDQLLETSFRYSQELNFSGGKEKRTYGISKMTGKILHECNMEHCFNSTDRENYSDEETMLIVERHQQTVRAVEPGTGSERWNYSVGHHELSLVHLKNTDCHGEHLNHPTFDEIEIRVSLPEGLVSAVNKSNSQVELWEHKFDSPVVSIWRETIYPDNPDIIQLKEINLFDCTKASLTTWSTPSIYIGMHQRQLYIQENPDHVAKRYLDHSILNTKYPWEFYPAIAHQVLDEDDGRNEITSETSVTALSVIYNSEYANGNGYYLYSKDAFPTSKEKLLNDSQKLEMPVEELPTEETVFEYFALRLKELSEYSSEVAIISLLTAILLNCLFRPHLVHTRLPNLLRRCFTRTRSLFVTPEITELPTVTPTTTTETNEEPSTSSEEKRSISVSEDENFTSRYLNDFEPIDCLGQGGYGIVFEAKNKVDGCHYAIKRITLSKPKSRDRVMREVKALAMLDHKNIVRYFNSWFESPPTGWQEEQDRLWRQTLKTSGSNFTIETTMSDSKVSSDTHTDVTSNTQSLPGDVFKNHRLCKSSNEDFSDDSLVVFENPEDETSVPITNGNFYDETETSDEEYSEKIGDKPKNHSNSVAFQISSDDEESEESEESKESEESEEKDVQVHEKKNTENCKPQKMYLYIQMQLCQKRSLKEWLMHNNSPRNYDVVVDIFLQIVDAVEYVHQNGLIHRDLKSGNIFFAMDNKVKVGDFGLVTAMAEGSEGFIHEGGICLEPCKAFCKVHTSCVGTHLYMSPEQIKGQQYNYKVDIYSLGVIFFELLTPFGSEMERVMALNALKDLHFPEGFASSYPKEYDLLKLMLNYNPKKRPTTLGIRARLSSSNHELKRETDEDHDVSCHFELPQRSRNCSISID